MQTALIGYSYETDGLFHTVSGVAESSPPVTGALQFSAVGSVRLQAATALVDVYNSSDMLLTPEAGKPDYAVEDVKSVFEMIKPHCRFHGSEGGRTQL